MGIGIVSDSDFEEELSKLSRPRKVVPSIVSIEKESHGRNEGDNNVPESLRKIIGETAVIDGRKEALSLAQAFGISSSSVSAYAKGATSTASYDNPKPSIVQHLNKSRFKAIRKASRTLNAALGSITQEKLDYSDAKDLSGIAKDMAVVIKNLEPQTMPTSGSEATTPQFVIFAPTFRDERSFETINVSDKTE